jgi:hypothetical protein
LFAFTSSSSALQLLAALYPIMRTLPGQEQEVYKSENGRKVGLHGVCATPARTEETIVLALMHRS